jgi:hypothetical protein
LKARENTLTPKPGMMREMTLLKEQVIFYAKLLEDEERIL